MSRYIEADEVTEQIRKKLSIKSLDCLLEAERQIVDVMQSAPSIDIVRCKDCKYCYYEPVDDIYHCWKLFHRFYTTDNYCSYGVRKGADDERGFF